MQISQVSVVSTEQLEQAITQYVAQGFVVANRSATAVTMIKKKEFKVIWAVIGFFLCVIPLLIYLVVYAREKDQLVEIRIVSPQAPGTDIQLSPDGRSWWDGSQWQDAETTVPPAAKRSADGLYWWDGAKWREVPALQAEGDRDREPPAQPPQLAMPRLEPPGPPPPPPSSESEGESRTLPEGPGGGQN